MVFYDGFIIAKINKRLNNIYFKYHPNSRYKLDDILDDILLGCFV